LGADAENAAAVRRVFEMKGRPPGHPVIVHLGDAAQLPQWAREIPAAAKVLAERFWPGPLTLVLPRTRRASDAVTGAQDTVAIRIPSHPVAREILRRFGGGVIAPSANRFGGPSATRAEHVLADLGPAVDLVVDGGPATIGVESTIVDLSGDRPRVLRPGGVTLEELADALGTRLSGEGGTAVRVPGSLPSHYAPRARVELVESEPEAEALARRHEAHGVRTVVVAWPDVERFAHDLYERLRAADREGAQVVVVVLPPDAGLGVAVRDRLRRAAAARDEGPGP
jgi:L-threonylcarbamoyladenylate synthase